MTGEQVTCAVCATPAVPGARFCYHCGAQLERTPADVEAERRVVTVLFGDLSDFTSWAEDLDPERVGVVTDRVLAACSRAVTDLGGHVDKLTGDGIMAVFGAPTARGDDAERAVRAAARMQREVHRLVASETGGGQRLGLRVGLNTGEVLAGIQAALSYTVVGDTVNTASRLSDAAGVGAVYAGRATARATEHIASWRPLEPLRLKGKREPVRAYELVGLRSSPVSRVAMGEEAAFVGREAETGRLVGRFMDVVEGERPAAVLVTGEPGIGKTRLVREFTRFAGELPGARVLWGRCSPYGEGRDLAPLVEWTQIAAGVSGDEPVPPGEVANRVRRLAQRVEGNRPGGLADALLALLGLAAAPAPAPTAPPGTQESEGPAIDGLVQLLGALGSAPLVLVVDDLQAAGAALIDALTTVGARLTGQAMLVGVHRSDPLDEPPDWWQKLPQPDVVPIGPLDAPAAERLLRSYLGGGELDPAARRAIVERAQGNPFFLAELVQLLVDRELLVRDAGAWRLSDEVAGDVIDAALPAGVQAVLAARIDTLDAPAKAVLRDAALVGTRVPKGALEALGHPPAAVAAAVRALEERGLVSVGGDGQPAFPHALARDVAYAGIPKAERARRHAVVAAWAPGGLGGTPADIDAFTAAHAERAVGLAGEMGLPLDDPAYAARHAGFEAYARLGEAAADRDEHAAAADLLGRALRLGADPAYGEDPAVIRRLRVARAGVLATAFRVEEAARELGDAPRAEDPALRARALVALGTIRRAQSDERGAAQAFEAALRAADEAGDDAVTVEALRDLGLLEYLGGRLLAAERRFREALALAERVGDLRGSGWALQHLTWSATTRGAYAVAEDALRRAWSVFTTLADEGGLSWCAGTESFVRVLQGRFRAARAITQQVLPAAEAMGERWGVSACLTIDAIAAAELGELALAEREAARARAGFRAAGDTWGEALALVATGFAARGAGDGDRAVDLLRQAGDLSRQSGNPVVESLAVTTLGYCHLDRGDAGSATEAARHALRVLAALDMEPHALVGPRVLLAQALRAAGELDAALQLLGEVAATAAEASLLFPRRQALAHYAGALLAAGQVDRAAEVVAEASEVPAEDVRSRVVTLRVRAAVLLAQGRPDDARLALHDALRVASSTESRSEVPATQRALAGIP